MFACTIHIQSSGYFCNSLYLEEYIGSCASFQCKFHSYGGKLTKLSVGWNIFNLAHAEVLIDVLQAVRFVYMHSKE